MGRMNLLKRRKLRTVIVVLFVLVCLTSCCTKCEAKRSRGSSRSSSRGSTSIFQRNSNRKGSSKEPSVQHPAQDGVAVPNSKGATVARPKSTLDTTAQKVDEKPVNQASAPIQQAAPPPYSGPPPSYNPSAGQQPIGWNVPNSGGNHQLHNQRNVGNTQSGYPQQPPGAPPAYSAGAYPPAYSPHGSYPNQGMQGGYPHQTPYGQGGIPPQGGYHQGGGYPHQTPYGQGGIPPQGGYQQGGGYNQMQSGGYGGYGGYHGGGGMMGGGFGGMGGGYGGFGALPYERKRGFGSGFGGTMVKVAAGMLIWNMVSNVLMPSRRYQVHNYYNNPETVPHEITLPANVITLCEGGSKDLCISGTIPLCTQNGTIMCVTTMANTVPCKENAGNCISTTESNANTDKTASTDALPCIANATVNNLDGLNLDKQQSSTTVNATINLFDGAKTQTIFCVTTLAIPAPDELPGENANETLPCQPGAENGTICNSTNPMPMYNHPPPPPGYPVGPVPGNPNPMIPPDQQQPPPMQPGYYYGPYGPYGYYGPYGHPYQWPPPPNQPMGPPLVKPVPNETGVTLKEFETEATTPTLDLSQDPVQNMEVMDQPVGPIESVPMNLPVIPRDVPHTTHHHVEDTKSTPRPLIETD